MIDERFIELIHGEIDGVNSARQSRKLHAYLNQNPEARTLYEDLRAMRETLSSLRQVDPPRNLKTLIMNQLPAASLAPRQERGRLVFSLERFLGRQKFGYAYAFSGGLALGLILVSLAVAVFLKPGSVNVSDLYGFMMNNSTAENFKTASSVHYDSLGIHCHISLSYSDEALLLHCALNSPEELTARVEFDPIRVQFMGFKKFSQPGTALTVDEHSVQFPVRGMSTCLVAFNRNGDERSPIHVKLVRLGTVVLDQEMRPE